MRLANNNAALSLILWLLAGTAALAQQSSIEVRSPSAKLLDTAPGKIVTVSVVVANRGLEADEIIETFVLPPGCHKVAPPDLPFRLPPRGQIVRVLAVVVPATMPAGRFALRYTAQSRRDPSSAGSVDLAIQVTAVDGVELIIEPQPGPVLAGDAYQVILRVRNHGNSRIHAELTHRSSLDFPVSTDASSFDLEGGASRVIACRVQTDKGFTRHTSHAVTFDITATSASGNQLTASQASVAEMIPLTSGKSDPFHHLPMRHRLIAFGATGQEGQTQVELSGAGSLDEAGDHRVDFLLRGPDAMTSNLFGERDEYGASYHSAHWDVDFGDRVYKLSPLTEKHSLGRGAGLTWHGGDTTIGGFYMTTRYRQHNTQELGAFVRYDITEQFSLQGNFLRKTGGDPIFARLLPQNLMTLESHYRLSERLDLRVEGGFSRSDDGSTDSAYRVDANGEVLGLSYSLEYVHAGPQFHGYYRNTDTIYASVSKTITDRLRARASFNRYAGNLELNDVLSTVVNRENSWTIGANYSLTKQTEFSLDWQHVKREDILAPAAYDFMEDAVRLGLSHHFKKLQLQGFLHFGSLDNGVTGESAAFQRISGTVNWQPTPRQTYSLFGSYGPSAFTGSADKAFDVGVSGNWQVRDNLIANLSCALNQYDGLIGSEQNQALASLRYEFKNKSSLSLVWRWARATTKAVAATATNVSAVMVTYSVPFEVPVSRKRSIGALQGRLCDSSKGSGVGLPRVVLQVGDRFAVTDDEGRFEFPGLKPGPCELQVRQDSLGPHLAMATPMPLSINIRPADVTFVDIAATPACSIMVTVSRHAFADGRTISSSDALTQAGGHEGAIVEVANGRDVWRAQTDRLGNAAFDRLPAGRWSLRVAAELPPHHTIEQPERTLTLDPGKTQQVAVRILPQRRTLRLLDQGAIR